MIGRRFISKEELEQALKDFGMHDGRDIKDIISEVDADNVSFNNVFTIRLNKQVNSCLNIRLNIFTIRLNIFHIFTKLSYTCSNRKRFTFKLIMFK